VGITLEEAIDTHFNKKSIDIPNEKEHVYDVKEIFTASSQLDTVYWIDSVRTERFTNSLQAGVLYRPDITAKIQEKIEELLKLVAPSGLMIKGPHGIGKSHTLVNVVRKLLSEGVYLVTFIPDCECWNYPEYLQDAICASFGAKFDEFQHLYPSFGTKEKSADSVFRKFIIAIDTILEKKGKKWVFVFDQINRLFVNNTKASDLPSLKFPFNMVRGMMKGRRIISVISASANNEVSYVDKHAAFTEFDHVSSMTREEIIILNDGITDTLDAIEECTGNVPLYVSKYIKAENEVIFFADQEEKIRGDIEALLKISPDPNLVKDNVVKMLNGGRFTTEPKYYDRKYFVKQMDDTYPPLFPLAGKVWRNVAWPEMSAFLKQKEGALVDLYNDGKTHASVRGIIYENIVIQRCHQEGVTFTIPLKYTTTTKSVHVSIPSLETKIQGDVLPKFDRLKGNNQPDGVYVPDKGDFPAIDMIWKSGHRLFAVQVYSNLTHADKFELFRGMCSAAGWLDKKFHVFFVYLRPYPNIQDELQEKYQDTNFKRGHYDKITIGLLDNAEVSCLKNITLRDVHAVHVAESTEQGETETEGAGEEK
jgi:hypothetical protein